MHQVLFMFYTCNFFLLKHFIVHHSSNCLHRVSDNHDFISSPMVISFLEAHVDFLFIPLFHLTYDLNLVFKGDRRSECICVVVFTRYIFALQISNVMESQQLNFSMHAELGKICAPLKISITIFPFLKKTICKVI